MRVGELHKCDNLMMAMREIWCSDEGDQGLNEGDFSKLQKGVQWFYLAILTPNMGVIPNPKMVFIFPISCILVLIFPFFMIYFPKCAGEGSFPKSQIKSLVYLKDLFKSSTPFILVDYPIHNDIISME